ncbi:hypothetical protein H4R18_001033 [Coemansia javaensis]|uniref:Uncharacterized protein n=1 Tax=Coemansia javaensis TaxID=2761396 RepID=A0A9W8LM56_9FUNG|nr:hypothetical protein H4R18_001033 [Coemansia javaensis]
MEGRKIERKALFGSGDSAPAADAQDVELFESMMKARLGGTQEDVSSPADPSTGDGTGATPSDEAPVFRMFFGAGPVKVATECAEAEGAAPVQPEADLEASDSEEHWSALAAAAVDAPAIRAAALVPLPAMRQPHRVIHVKAGDAEGSAAASTTRARRRSKKAVHRAQGRPEPYVRVPSPYKGGVLRGEMLADVVRREEARAKRQASRASARRGRGGGVRGRGRGRGRGHPGLAKERC